MARWRPSISAMRSWKLATWAGAVGLALIVYLVLWATDGLQYIARFLPDGQ